MDANISKILEKRQNRKQMAQKKGTDPKDVPGERALGEARMDEAVGLGQDAKELHAAVRKFNMKFGKKRRSNVLRIMEEGTKTYLAIVEKFLQQWDKMDLTVGLWPRATPTGWVLGKETFTSANYEHDDEFSVMFMDNGSYKYGKSDYFGDFTGATKKGKYSVIEDIPGVLNKVAKEMKKG